MLRIGALKAGGFRASYVARLLSGESRILKRGSAVLDCARIGAIPTNLQISLCVKFGVFLLENAIQNIWA